MATTLLQDAQEIAAIDPTVNKPGHPDAHAKLNAFVVKIALAVAALGNAPATPIFGTLEGQSNAEGQARKSELPAGYTGALANTNIITPATGSPFRAVEGGVTTSTGGGDNWGVEVSMMKKLASLLGKPVYLSKYAVGGTQLAPGNGDDWSETSTGELYDKANANYTLARAALPAPAQCAFEVWIQGESDANTTNAPGYETRLRSRIAAKRAFYGAAVPIFIVQMSSGQTFNGQLDAASMATVRQAQATVAASVPGCYLITTNDLPLDGELLHWTAAGLITLGERLADKIFAVLSAPPVAATLKPGVTGDDLVNTITITHPYGIGATEARITDTGEWVTYTATPGYNASTGKIDVGDVDRAAGYFQFRTKADSATNRLASETVLSSRFTVAATVPTDPTGAEVLPSTDLASAAWNPTDVIQVGGQSDGAGGTTAVLVRPTPANNNNHNIHTADFVLPTGNYDFYIRSMAAGYDFMEIVMVAMTNFVEFARVLVNVNTGQRVGGDTTATVAALPDSRYRTKFSFGYDAAVYGQRVYVFVKVWSDANRLDYAGDNAKGIVVSHAHLEKV